MTTGPTHPRNRKTPPKRRTFPWGMIALVVAGFVGAGLLVFVAWSAESGDEAPGGRANVPDNARDTQLVAGLEAVSPWSDHGTVPVDTPVSHEWLLRNTGEQAISLGSARIETLEGC